MRSSGRREVQRACCSSAGLLLACAVVLTFAVAPALGAGDPLAKAKALAEESERLCADGRFADVLPKAREALAIREELLSPIHRDVAESLHNLAELLDLTGDRVAARPLYERALTIARVALGPIHPDVQVVRKSFLRLLEATDDNAAAISVFEQALADHEQVLGPTHPDVAEILDGLAGARVATKDYKGAIQALERALLIRERVLGPGHQEVANRLENLGIAQSLDGDYVAARRSFERALRIREKELGPGHPTVIKTLARVADTLKVTGDFAAAKSLYERMLRVQEGTLGPDHAEVGTTLQRLGELHRDAGDLRGAKAAYERGLRIREATLGRMHADFFRTVNDLALVLSTLGDYPTARWLYMSALQGYREANRSEALNREIVATLNGLGGIFMEMGDYGQAGMAYQEAIQLAETALGPDDHLLATILTNYAVLQTDAGDTNAARPLLERALAIQERTLGKKHPDLAHTLNNLAVLLQKGDDRARALTLFQRAKDILEEASKGGDAFFAAILTNLGNLAEAASGGAAARPYYAHALQIRERALGGNHPVVARSLVDLARVDWAQGSMRDAAAGLRRAVRIVRVHTAYALTGLSHRQQSAFLETTKGFTDLLLSLPPQAVINVEAYEAVLDRKNPVFRILARERVSRLADLRPEVAALVKEYAAARRQLAALMMASDAETSAAGSTVYRAQMDRLHIHMEALEAQLSWASADFRQAQAEISAGLSTVCAAVPHHSALIEFFEYERFTPPSTPEGTADVSPHYVAFVVRGGDCQAPVRVDLGPVYTIDEDVARFRETVSRDVSDGTGRALREKYRRIVGARLAARLFPAALRAAVAGKPRLIIAPGGVLAHLPFALLPGEDGREFLLETRTIIYAPSGRDLLRAKGETPVAPGFLAVGGPTFGRAPGEAAQAVGLRSGCGGAGDRFAPLPGATAEIQALAAAYRQTQLSGSMTMLEGAQATKAAFLEHAPKAGIVHVATHAYVEREECVPLGLPEGRPQGARGETRTGKGDHPLLLTGIAFAGANERENADGILTALEITALDLEKTDVVVLSACETGLGVLAPRQETLGLRWAFAYAGAKNVIASLWTVPDEETATLMAHFYTAVWQQKLPVPDALRAAQLAMLRSARANGDARVHAWGAFTTSGRE